MKRMCESIRRRNEYYRILYEDIRRREKALGRIRHELGNLFVLQLSYLESGRYEELRRLYLNLIESLRASGTVIHTGNIGLDSIVSFKLRQAQQRRIDAAWEIRVGGRILIGDRDINSLMGNLFDNAVEACLRLPRDRRKIRLKITSSETAFYFQMANSFDGRLCRNCRGELLSRKPDKKNHGIGMKTVRRIARKYCGDIRIEQQEDMFVVKGLLYFRDKL